ncbi:hypothetical protein [Acinetobacter sp. WCHAc060025]|uniref:hypothetical protein n=1 Tax=Acinetobacter sp. WCHAc060025 TaxID=2518625 RepID=UPI001023DD4B|nr:hypothetical protein [Acinetobacter sp. WCHAc060025]RZG77763.1 hypothetical protein EXE09_02260 [Acinetobacter sp. WCHAc060025]
MGRDFEWLRWVGLSVVLSILGAVYFVNSKNHKNEIEVNQDAQLQADREYEKNLDEVAMAMHEAQMEAQYTQDNPSAYPKISLQQTISFINRVEQLRSSDSQINLEYTPDVARQSRKYNALVDEAEAVYGDMNIANHLRYCTVFVDIARNLWQLQYSPSRDAKFDQHSYESYSKNYEAAKQGCLEDVQAKLIGNPSA